MTKSAKIASLFSIIIIVLFLAYNSYLLPAATKGITICVEVIIPSLFPFTAVILFLFDCGILNLLSAKISVVTRCLFGLNGEAFIVFVMSLFGGYPVGAKLINKMLFEGKISENSARRMINYSVNPGPAFVILGIGKAIYNNTLVGVILYASNVLSSVLLCILLSRREIKEETKISSKIPKIQNVADSFVQSVADASSSIITICGCVILFSSIIGVISEIIKTDYLKPIVALLEISNGTIIFRNNIYLISFITAFSGFCVHAQIFALCKNFKIKYSRFLFFRIINGILSVLFSFALVKIFKPTIKTMALSGDYIFRPSIHTVALSLLLIFMAFALLISINEKRVEKKK